MGLWLAACAESGSEHPIGRAIMNKAKSIWGGKNLMGDGTTIDNWKIVPGRGVECTIKHDTWGENKVRVGKKEFACENMPDTESNSQITFKANQLREQGKIAVFVGISPPQTNTFQPISLFGIVDPVKSSAKRTCQALLDQGIDVYMCTGDHEITANAVGRELNIPPINIRAGVAPEGKAEFVAGLISMKEGKVAVVGDGINDSVALARADVGIAVGAGTEVALEAADIILVRSDLTDVLVVLHLSKTVFSRIKLNFVWAMGYNVCALPFAAGAFSQWLNWRLPPAFAGLMMAFSSVSVVTSSLLLRLYKKPIITEEGTLMEMDLCSRTTRFICRRDKRTRRGKGEAVYGVADDDDDTVTATSKSTFEQFQIV